MSPKKSAKRRAMRAGKPLTTLADGHPRRMSDGRNAVKKMSASQRDEFIRWMVWDMGLADEIREILCEER